MTKLELNIKELHLLTDVLNNEKCLNNPEEYPYAKPITQAPKAKTNTLFADLSDIDAYSDAEIDELIDGNIIKMTDDMGLIATALGRAYFESLAC